MRSAAGFANGDRNSTVANFYFGGFGNNYVDDKSIKRYREYSSFPGFDIDQISALSFVREMDRMESAAIRVRVGRHTRACTSTRCGRPSSWEDCGRILEIRRCRKDLLERRRAGRPPVFKVLHWYDMTLSIGYAIGFQGSQKAGTEWMISLKIM